MGIYLLHRHIHIQMGWSLFYLNKIIFIHMTNTYNTMYRRISCWLTSKRKKCHAFVLEIGGATWTTWRLKLGAWRKSWRCFVFYMPNSLEWLLYWLLYWMYLSPYHIFCALCIIMSKWGEKNSKLQKFLQKEKLFVLIDYSLIIIDYTSCLKLVELCLILIDYSLIIIDYTIVFEKMIDLFRSFFFNQLPCDIIDYFSFYKCFRIGQEHFNLLLWISNRLHCSWVISRF